MTGIKESGFSLVELMIGLAIVGVLMAIALPAYQTYQAEARVGVIRDNIQSIHLLQVERRTSFGEYVEGTYAPGGAATLTTRLGWSPGTSVDEITYVVACTTDGTKTGECAPNSGYSVTGTHPDLADPVVLTF
ncbi:MAG: type II secretion system protein [Pseudomonadales bacterium]|nr:type II secretion system protein [Pseudomonadales bacterium]MBO6566250.1 type II secretion system protein [Pseudomonadales bacterium]MBO6594273.1 type II secretion system protein [Pseudomonadales bacterium]MBO6822166.1 type II secretion system protein [Pseudomonadales bacterium]